MNKTMKVIITIIATLVIGAILLVVGIMGCGIISAIAIPSFVKNKEKAEQMQLLKEKMSQNIAKQTQMNEDSNEPEKYDTANVLQRSLENAKLEYETIEGKKPERFDDFVLLEGELSGSHTYSFSDLEDDITEPNKEGDLHMKKLDVVFKNGVEAMYYLEPDTIKMEIVKE